MAAAAAAMTTTTTTSGGLATASSSLSWLRGHRGLAPAKKTQGSDWNRNVLSHFEIVNGDLREFVIDSNGTAHDSNSMSRGEIDVPATSDSRRKPVRVVEDPSNRQKSVWDFVNTFDSYKTSRLYEV